ncbi:MAG: S41 family peptidase [Oscillatoria sp. PMC 1068.18]|nr:S41 family peptidase [Oscillatoria sp. PMC 1076.18]MEC4989727.1 S41 family peptidase [Oscillatoria sp. PMC 1068.18]
MKKSTKKLSAVDRFLLGGAIAVISTVSVFTPGIRPSVSAALEDSPKTVVDEVWQIVNNEYVDRSFNSVNWQAKRQELLSKNYTSREQAYSTIREALREIGDPYTRFLDPEQFEALSSQTSGELSGVGIRMEIDKKTKILTVVEPIENSPATQADIRTGDQIIEIDGKKTAKMSIEEASALIRGETGTEVRLKMARNGRQIFETVLTRAQIELPAVRYTLKEEGNKRVGYIKLEEFSSHAAEQMEKAIAKLNHDKVDAFVLDLRGNPGGLLFASVDIARMWMETGTIVRTVDRKGGDRQFAANRTALTNLPLVVLVDEYSASASEILAGALKDNGRATIVGNRTYGKGTVQSVHALSDGSGLAVTISRYYPPSGVDINKRGITPDIQLGLTAEQQLRLTSDPSLVGTGHDPQYARAISFLSRR